MVGEALVRHPGVDKVTFTGSPRVGRGILQGAAGNFKKVTLELGGKSANVIFADANLDRAARSAASGIFFNAGQVCSAGSRVLVQRPVYDEVVLRLAERAKKIRVGDPSAPGTTMGPVISAGQMNTVLNYIAVGKAEGASAVTGVRVSATWATSSNLRYSRTSNMKCGFPRKKSLDPYSP